MPEHSEYDETDKLVCNARQSQAHSFPIRNQQRPDSRTIETLSEMRYRRRIAYISFFCNNYGFINKKCQLLIDSFWVKEPRTFHQTECKSPRMLWPQPRPRCFSVRIRQDKCIHDMQFYCCFHLCLVDQLDILTLKLRCCEPLPANWMSFVIDAREFFDSRHSAAKRLWRKNLGKKSCKFSTKRQFECWRKPIHTLDKKKDMVKHDCPDAYLNRTCFEWMSPKTAKRKPKHIIRNGMLAIYNINRNNAITLASPL